ncbi:coiled-coil domain-containing protein 148 [Nothobranchius furzeri]|uniref:Coiled-coil domain containing 148 n=4 Tax=Nothobranchius TaxID=28779 RepID=A0A1A8AB07_NOTFU|nr:coiled-coil domain-containing protein 148 [Nothobranchius furzeri]KAF7215958.1 coiled-coil domain containing 148 [Nothobranchius furzeri]
MSGRSLPAFNTRYKAEDAERLTLRMKNGLGSSRYKPAEYERLQAIVEAKRMELDLIGQKVQKSRCAAKATKESSLLQQHRQVWSKERTRLQKAEKQAKDGLHHFLDQIRPIDVTDTAIFSLQEYVLFLEREREAFRKDTVDPIYQLRDDLRSRLGKMQHQQLHKYPSNWEPVKEQVNFVKDQQEYTVAKLKAEYKALEEEMEDLGLEKSLNSALDSLVGSESVPKEVLDANSPDPELKDSLIQTFQSISERYQSRLQSLQEKLQQTDRFCGWSADDHKRFQFIVSLYTHDVPKHRELKMDMLSRLFPQRTNLELIEHQRLWDLRHFTQSQLRLVTQQWHRDVEELLASARVMLQEADHAHQEELELHRQRQHQQDICLHLKEKLKKWRAQQEEVAKLEAAIAARRQEEEEERMKREQEQEAAVRSQQKEKVKQFHLKQQKRTEVLERRDQERLAALRSIMEEQARRDRQRVQFRADVLQQRRKEREELELERQREEQDKQNRLEALRKQVEVVAEADPERMMGDTEAWKSRHLNENELQKPLYSLSTYTDTQILSDPRVRLEQALREAGLQQSQYSKAVLSEVKPPKPPRRDTESTLKF